MDAEFYRKPMGLVDRMYEDQLGPRPITDEEIYSRYVLKRKTKDPYEQEIGPGRGLVDRMGKWLDRNVSAPMAEAGFGTFGDSVSSIPMAAANLMVPQTAGDYAGMLIPFGKAGKALSQTEKLKKARLDEKLEEMASRLHGPTDAQAYGKFYNSPIDPDISDADLAYEYERIKKVFDRPYLEDESVADKLIERMNLLRKHAKLRGIELP